MNRENDKEREREAARSREAEYAALKSARKRERTGVRQFLKEVRQELRRVAWPSRKEVASYSLVVLVAVSLIGLYIFGLDQVFGQFVFWVFR